MRAAHQPLAQVFSLRHGSADRLQGQAVFARLLAVFGTSAFHNPRHRQQTVPPPFLFRQWFRLFVLFFFLFHRFALSFFRFKQSCGAVSVAYSREHMHLFVGRHNGLFDEGKAETPEVGEIQKSPAVCAQEPKIAGREKLEQFMKSAVQGFFDRKFGFRFPKPY